MLVLDVGTALIGFFWFGTEMDGVAALEEPTVLSATSFANVPPTTLPPPPGAMLPDEFFMVFFNDCIICE